MIEGLYRLDVTSDQWLLQATELVQPLLDRHRLGVIGNFYECVDPGSYVSGLSVVRDAPAWTVGRFFSYIAKPDPAYIAESILSRRCYFCGRIPAKSDVPAFFEQSRRDGLADRLTVNAIEPDGHGCCFGAFQADRSPLSPDSRAALRRIAGHLGAAYRLRRRAERTQAPAEPAAAAAVMTADGRVQHAVGVAAKNPRLRRDLREAVRARDAARTRGGRQDSLRAIRDWKPFVGGRWMLLDHVERDGRQFVLAVESEAGDRLALLSPRERDIVRRMLEGQTDKVIAYELGVVPGTVRVLMRNASAKLGAHSRAELRAIARPLRRDE